MDDKKTLGRCTIITIPEDVWDCVFDDPDSESTRSCFAALACTCKALRQILIRYLFRSLSFTAGVGSTVQRTEERVGSISSSPTMNWVHRVAFRGAASTDGAEHPPESLSAIVRSLLEVISHWPNVGFLHLYGIILESEQIEQMAKLPQLREVVLEKCRVLPNSSTGVLGLTQLTLIDTEVDTSASPILFPSSLQSLIIRTHSEPDRMSETATQSITPEANLPLLRHLEVTGNLAGTFYLWAPRCPAVESLRVLDTLEDETVIGFPLPPSSYSSLRSYTGHLWNALQLNSLTHLTSLTLVCTPGKPGYSSSDLSLLLRRERSPLSWLRSLDLTFVGRGMADPLLPLIFESCPELYDLVIRMSTITDETDANAQREAEELDIAHLAKLFFPPHLNWLEIWIGNTHWWAMEDDEAIDFSDLLDYLTHHLAGLKHISIGKTPRPGEDPAVMLRYNATLHGALESGRWKEEKILVEPKPMLPEPAKADRLYRLAIGERVKKTRRHATLEGDREEEKEAEEEEVTSGSDGSSDPVELEHDNFPEPAKLDRLYQLAIGDRVKET